MLKLSQMVLKGVCQIVSKGVLERLLKWVGY